MEKEKSLEDLSREVSEKLDKEEETENNLIWIYDTLINMGVEECFSPSVGLQIKEKMKILADESRGHKIIIRKIREKNNI